MPASPLSRHGLKPSRLCILGALVLLGLVFGWPALAQGATSDPDDAALCDAAAARAGQRRGVPLDVLRAITRLETGRSRGGALAPWPWALNAGGTGHWLSSKAAASTKAREILSTGRRNLDLGCFQINYRWHGARFASLDDMLDPVQNADYAARYLVQHYKRLGDWTAAIGAYHSRTPEYANRYLARYRRIANALAPTPRAPLTGTDPDTGPARVNGFALLAGTNGTGDSGQRGSLVPVSVLAGRGALVPMGGIAR